MSPVVLLQFAGLRGNHVGDWRLDSTLHFVVLSRSRHHGEMRDHVTLCTAEGKVASS
jgi:hypothetical protein